jgi:hypothetical protein
MNQPFIDRRSLLKLGVGVSALAAVPGCTPSFTPDDDWQRGDLQHLLPLVSHNAFNIKLSFNKAMLSVPALCVNQHMVSGERQDSQGRFWAFRMGGLAADTEYTLQLFDQEGIALYAS